MGERWPFRGVPSSGPCVFWSSHWMRAIPSEGAWPWRGDPHSPWLKAILTRGLSWAPSAAMIPETGKACLRHAGRTQRTLRAPGWDVLTSFRTQKLGGVKWVQDPGMSHWGDLTQVPSGSALLFPAVPMTLKKPHTADSTLYWMIIFSQVLPGTKCWGWVCKEGPHPNPGRCPVEPALLHLVS